MILNNPRSTERDNQNSLRKFPFSDAASCTARTGVIPPGAVVDAQLYVPGREPGRVWMSKVDTDGRLHFSDAAGEFAVTTYAATAESAVPVTFTGDGGPCHGGVVVFGSAADVASLRALGGQKLTADQAELAPAAVSWPGLPGVFGFKLDDGHVVYGDVKMRGENGCVVATYKDDDGLSRLRISAMGRTVDTEDVTGFITRVVAVSDNTNFAVANRDVSGRVIDVLLTGVSTMGDDKLNADQEDLCARVREKTGTVPSPRASRAADCEADVCADPASAVRKITLIGYNNVRVQWTADVADSYIPVTDGAELGRLLSMQIAAAPAGKRFAGYYDAETKTAGTPLTLYYRYDGTGARRFTAGADITLYAHFVDASSTAEATFGGYGTLHLAAPNQAGYTNPLRISGQDSPIPVLREYQDEVLEAGGADALADLILHPVVPSGEVRIGIRGANKASLL